MIIITVKNLVVMLKVAGTRLESLSAEQLCNVVLNKDNNDHNCLYMNAILTSPTCCNHLEMVLFRYFACLAKLKRLHGGQEKF